MHYTCGDEIETRPTNAWLSMRSFLCFKLICSPMTGEIDSKIISTCRESRLCRVSKSKQDARKCILRKVTSEEVLARINSSLQLLFKIAERIP